MKTTDFSKPVSSHTLNENLYKQFGVKVDLNKYTREELEDARNKIRTEISQLEAKSNFNDLLTNENYQKNKHLVGILNTRIKEMLGESIAIMERKLSTAEKKKKEEIVKAIKRDNPEKRTGKGKSSAYAIATAQAKKVAESDKGDMDHDGKDEPDSKEYMDNKDAAIKKAMGKDKKVKEGFPTVADAKARHEKEQGTGKFDQKPNKETGGTIYTRKSSTFTNGTEDKPKDKKVKEGSKNLPGNQEKIDADGDGKIEKSDFAKLRAGKKKMKESQHKQNVKVVNESIRRLLAEDEEGKAKSITAGTDMVNDFTSWMTRVGQYQTKSMIELADAIRANFGQEQAETFKQAVAPALETALNTLTQAREQLSNAVAVLAGESSPMDTMGGDGMGMDGAPEAGMDTMNAGNEEVPMDDEFGAADAAAGGAEMSGRGMRESRRLFAAKLNEAHSIVARLSK
jgi:CHASE3 domain sensor protein